MSAPYSKIITDPLTHMRQEIADIFFSGTLDVEQLNEVVEKMATAIPDKADTLWLEFEKVKQAFATGDTKEPLLLEDPATATLWGAALAAMAVKTRAVHKLPIWQRVINHPVIQQERQESGYELYRSFRKIGFSDFKVTLSPPGSGYPAIAYYADLEGKVVNLDPLWMLLLGVEKARAGMMHEVAHALGTLGFTPKMQKLRDEMDDIKKKTNETSGEDKARFADLNIEWQHRYYIADEAENSYANRFVINRGQSGAEDYGLSLNHIEAVFGGIGKAAANIVATPKGKPSATDAFRNLKRAIRYSLFRNNGFFPNTPAGWRSIGVEPDWIAEVGPKGRKGWPALKALAELTEKMEILQPRAGEMIAGAEHFKKKNTEFWQKRMEVVDQIYDQYAAPLVAAMKQEAEQKQQQEKDEKPENAKKEKDEKEQQQGEPQENEEASGPDDTQPDDKQKADGGEAEKDAHPRDTGDGETKPSGGQAGEQAEDREPAQAPQSGGDEEGEGAGMTLPPETPQEINRPLQDAPQAEGDTDDSPTVSDLVEQQQAREDAANAAAPENKDDKPRDSFNKAQGKGGAGHEKRADEIGAPQRPVTPKPVDLNEFEKLVAQHQAAITHIEKYLRKIMDRQAITKKIESPQRTLFPKDGNPAGLDTAKLQRTLGAIAAGKVPRIADFKNFKVDARTEHQSAEMDIEIIIDISGSLTGKPFERLMETAAMLYDAARRVKGVNVSITAMGAPAPMPVARPGQDSDTVSRNIIQVRQTMGGGQDFLSPALGEMLSRYVADKTMPAKKTGMTHAFVVSDGFFGDAEYAVKAASALHDSPGHLSLDFLVLETPSHPLPPISAAVAQMESGKGARNISQRRARVDGDIGPVLIEMVENRLKQSKQGEAVARKVKRDEFEKALKEMHRRMKL